MNIQEIKELMQTMAQTGVTTLDWNSCGAAIHLERQISAGGCCGSSTDPSVAENTAMSDSQAALDVSSVKTSAGLVVQASEDEASEAAAESKSGELVKSPVVGIYYSSPSPDSDPFVRQGSRIEKGNPLCIIEAMKLMNEVSSPFGGEIAEIFVENGQRVEFGQPLFRII